MAVAFVIVEVEVDWDEVEVPCTLVDDGDVINEVREELVLVIEFVDVVVESVLELFPAVMVVVADSVLLVLLKSGE